MSHVPAAQVQNKQAAWANPIICCWNQLDFFFGEAGGNRVKAVET